MDDKDSSKKPWYKHKKFLGIAAFLLAAGFVTAILLGPATGPTSTLVGRMTAAINGVPTTYTGTLTPWTVTITSNIYTRDVLHVIPRIEVTASSALTDCSSITLQESADNVAYAEVFPTFLDHVCTFQGDDATYGQTVAAGSTSNIWYFKSAIVASNSVSYQWTVQLVGA